MIRRSRRRYGPWRWSTLYPLVVLACACAIVLVGLAVLLRARRPVPTTCREVLLAQIEEYARWAAAPERQRLEQRDPSAYAGERDRFLLDYRELEAYDAWWRRTVAPTPVSGAGRTVPRPADLRDPQWLDWYLADEAPDGPCGDLPEDSQSAFFNTLGTDGSGVRRRGGRAWTGWRGSWARGGGTSGGDRDADAGAAAGRRRRGGAARRPPALRR